MKLNLLELVAQELQKLCWEYRAMIEQKVRNKELSYPLPKETRDAEWRAFFRAEFARADAIASLEMVTRSIAARKILEADQLLARA
jgi:hypothetical protein